MIDLGGRVRLVKGAYKEPKTIAWQAKADVDEAFVRIMKILLKDGTYPAIATHDPAMIAATKAYATEIGLGQDGFEFQMLYGVRRDLQASLDGRRLSRTGLHSLRARVVPVLHAAPRRAPRQRPVRPQERPPGALTAVAARRHRDARAAGIAAMPAYLSGVQPIS